MLTLYTVGHSNRVLDAFMEILDAHAVRCIADVRAFPSSRRWPHFNREPLAAAFFEGTWQRAGNENGIPVG